MKVKLGNSPDCDYGTIAQFANGVVDSEAREIVCENFLSSFSPDELDKLLDIILSKLRISGSLIIKDHDFELICNSMFTGSLTLEQSNSLVFSGGSLIKSMTSLELIEEKILRNGSCHVTHKELGLTSFTLTVKRS